MAAGCGNHSGGHAAQPTVHPAAVRAQILNSMASWETTSASVKDVVKLRGSRPLTLQLRFLTASAPSRYALTVNEQRRPQLSVVDNGRNTVSYTAGQPHYAVLSTLSLSSDAMRLIGPELEAVVRQAKLQSAALLPSDQARLVMKTRLPDGQLVTAILTYDLSHGAPLAFAAQWQGGQIVETVEHFAANPDLPNSAFNFRPPTGVTPEVTATPTTTALNVARDEVHFPIVLPPSAADLTLQDVTVQRESKGGPVVVLTYTTPGGSYIVLTERATRLGQAVAPAGVNVGPQTFGVLTFNEGVLPFSGEFASTQMQRTEIWIEGPASAVDNLLTVWGNAPTASP